MRVTMIGHSTLLIETEDDRIITDPFFAEAPAPGMRRTVPPSMTAEEAAATATLVLVSHNHPDHCDPEFFAALPPAVPVVVPKGMEWPGGIDAPAGAAELGVWESRDFGDVRVAATPADHPPVSAGYVIRAEKRRIYFAGDTNAGAFMRQIGNEYALEVAALPIRHVRRGTGITAGTIVEVAEMLDVERVIAMHLHVRRRGGALAHIKDPAGKAGTTLTEWKPGVRFNLLDPGESVKL